MAQSEKSNSSAVIRKLDEHAARFAQLWQLMNDPGVLSNPQRIVAVSRESGQLEPLVEKYRAYQKLRDSLSGLRELTGGADREMAE
ncbi:MAG: PCRF domain-containing protein, partial [Tepidisphaeraceae bacterium]